MLPGVGPAGKVMTPPVVGVPEFRVRTPADAARRQCSPFWM
jgi:hypothetical protein